jgi:NAD(P)H-dependent FMN reductase
MKATLHIVVASTREGRTGEPIAAWFLESATRHGGFEVETIDLNRVNLPFLDERHHPKQQRYEHEHTKAWSALVSKADAFVFVTPEYNHGSPPALVNALDHLYVEWNYKPAGFVSYGGVSGGLRSVQMTKQILLALKVVPIPEGVVIPLVSSALQEGVFKASEAHEKAAQVMLDELLRWTLALRALRS